MLVNRMVLIFDGNSEMVAHERRNIVYLICLRHLTDREWSQIGGLFSPKRSFFNHERAQHAPSYHLILVPWHAVEGCSLIIMHAMD